MTNKEAIEILSNRLNTYYCTDEDLQALDLAIKALEERLQGGWIPCKERLPDKEDWYIVTEWDYSHQCWDTSISEFHASGRWGYGNDKVIAWMPMPEIYQEAQHE